MKTSLLILAAMLFAGSVHAQSKAVFYVSPAVSIGYTLGCGINYGFEVDMGLMQFKTPYSPCNLGLTVSKSWVHLKKKKVHRFFSVNLMAESSYFDVKAGIGTVRNKWGYGNRNRCLDIGFNLDLSISTKSMLAPWMGYKLFLYDKYNWAWYNRYYRSVYVKYKYDFLKNSQTKASN